jgi:class 3 adenylate cyclase
MRVEAKDPAWRNPRAIVDLRGATLAPVPRHVHQRRRAALHYRCAHCLSAGFFHHDSGPADSCGAAFAAACQALSRIASVSHTGVPLHAGVALHHGEVAYGNIGSEGRLDFTVIGRDVNLVSRIQTVCATTGHPLLMSPQFAATLRKQTSRSIGNHPLKGFPEPIELFTSDAL